MVSINRMTSQEIATFRGLMPSFQEFLDIEAAGASVKVSVDEVTVHPLALSATFKVRLSGDPRDTIIVSYGTRNGIGTNAGSQYTAKTGRLIFQPGEPIEKEIVISLRGNNQTGNTVELVFSNTVYGGSFATPTVRRIYFSEVIPPAVGEWNLLYETDFINGFEFSDSGLTPDGRNCWGTRLAHGRTQPNNNELGLYADPIILPGTNPFPIVDGKRCLRAESLTHTWTENNVTKTYNYTAAVLRSNRIRLVRDNNKVVARFALSRVAISRGGWPGFWLLPSNGAWPPELDMLEQAVHSTATDWKMFTTQHWQDTAHRSKFYDIDIRDFGITTPLTEPHDWGIELTPKEIYHTVDGVRYVTMENRSPGRTWYALLDLAIGGLAGAPNANTVFPMDMRLDWIKFYEKVV